MAVLVTRPEPDNAATAALLRARGFQALLAPMLRFGVIAGPLAEGGPFGGVIVTSANAMRAVADHPALPALLGLPVFAVGAHTARAARDLDFSSITSADGDAIALRDRIVRAVARQANCRPLLYLCADEVSRDLARELGDRGLAVVRRAVYRMTPVQALPAAVAEAFTAHHIEAVLHYSRRSARAFVDAARGAGIEIAALLPPQLCISGNVAEVLRDAGAARAVSASYPDEASLLDLLGRAKPGQAG